MAYEGGTKYEEEDFHGWTKHGVLEEEVSAFMHNMEAAGVSPSSVVYALQEAVKEIKNK